MMPDRAEVAKAALYPVQILGIILKALGDGETPVDPGAVSWLGERLGAAYEDVDRALNRLRKGCGA